MHNCSETKEQITELLLDGADRRPNEDWCSECRAEFDALNATLRMTARLREAAAPAEDYWTSYHARLREKLSRAKAQRRKEEPASAFAPLRLCVRTTVQVPVPLVIAVILAFAVLGLFAIRAARETTTNPTPIIVHVPVEVPVVQEKFVTRVVYRERRSNPRSSKQIINAAKIETTFAKSQKPRNEDIPASLTGFKPAEEIKFTIIKGGSPNEK
jgi:hypothetical protein